MKMRGRQRDSITAAPDPPEERQLQQRQRQADRGYHRVGPGGAPDVDQETDGHCRQRGETVVQHVNAHHPASEGVWDHGLNQGVVSHPEDVLKKTQPSQKSHGREIPEGLGKPTTAWRRVWRVVSSGLGPSATRQWPVRRKCTDGSPLDD